MTGFRRAVAATLLFVGLHLAQAATVSYDFNITWVTANPDGAFNRPVIGVNGKWPVPRIDVNVGDRLIINVDNQLGNQTTSLHFHGLFLEGHTHMDGPAQVTQCTIQPGGSFLYNFTVSSSVLIPSNCLLLTYLLPKINQPGTYWWHSHSMSSYPDGLRAPLVVHDPDRPFKGQYDEEIVMSLSDWYHDQMQDLLPAFISKGNPTGAEPVPQAALFNDTQNLTISVEPGKTYLFRLVNVGAFAGQYFWVEGHNISIVEVDGVYTKPATAEMIYISVAQRYSFLLTAKNDTKENFAFVGSMDTVCEFIPLASRRPYTNACRPADALRCLPSRLELQRHRLARLRQGRVFTQATDS